MLKWENRDRVVVGSDSRVLLQGPVSPECWVTVWHHGPLTRVGIARLILYLELAASVYPPNDEAESAPHGEREAGEGGAG